ncbi:hypothetical protein LINPERPRIM_LOCUS21425 [Linum perenne]
MLDNINELWRRNWEVTISHILERATELLTCLPTTDTPTVLVFMLIVFILLRLTELYGVIM